MASLEEKKKAVAELEEKFKTSKAAVFTDYRGIKVEEATDLRRNCRDAGVEFRVVKNTLTQRAAESSGAPDISQFMDGPTAVAFSYEDPVAPAKTLRDFMKKYRKLEFKGGLIEGAVVGADSVGKLADLPSKDVLVSMVLRGLNGPLTGLCGVLQGPIKKLVYALQAVQEKKEEAS
jgi:large subunit ribosomal protein L10